MGRLQRLRRGAVAAVVALAVPVSLCSASRAADPEPTPGWTLPSDADVADAKEAAVAAAREVAVITAEVDRAEARLRALQRQVADAVAADELARTRLAAGEEALSQATEALARARLARDHADRALSGTAALLYMQGGELQNLGTLLLSPPNVMADLSVVLDHEALRVQSRLDTATSTAAAATASERRLTAARRNRALALEEAVAKRSAVERSAARAGAEAATLAQRQAQLTARLARLEQVEADLVGLREAAARLGDAGLVGVQAAGSLGSGPRAAQAIARSKMESFAWAEAEFVCLVSLWHAESGWSWSATNPSSGAYGIPQALPGWKMASAGSDWLTNPATQIDWGLGYIEDVYGSPCAAMEKWLSRSPHWY
ncbi:coiled-coil domain-containing protein [Oryzobacter sp. R7]|uniref:coiled-coil domain-containing protein n=1 Tax=Oryzobacter faecalis TaxID=3388656 RepID=UPI00398D018F